MAASSSSASAITLQASPQVYLNFRGALRYNFISHLEKAFGDGDINCFIDSESTVGPALDSLFKSIDKSKIALVIFSKEYSQSYWCLRELTKIMENVKKNKLIVIPIFLDVKVEDVKHLKGEFGQNLYDLSYHDGSYQPEWEETLKSVPTKVSLTRKGHRTESDFIVNIVLAVKEVLVKISPEGRRISEQPTRDLTLYGVEERLKKLEEMFMGMRSIGKTISEMQFSIQVINEKITLLNVRGLNDETEMSTMRTDRKVYLPPQHQVFISFRGEQLRYNFISHLVGALRRKMINVFIDKQENKGEDISNLLKRIEESRIAIVVFSRKYTESKWCLREAETIMERAAQGKLKVLPIFYKVNPTNVRQLKGEFGDNFRDREWEYCNDRSVIEKWKEALAYIAGKIGFALNDQSDENDSIASIVNEVMRMLTSIPLDTQTGESCVNQL